MVESAGCVKFPLHFLARDEREGGFTSDCLFTMKACKVKMITVPSAKSVSSQTGMRARWLRSAV